MLLLWGRGRHRCCLLEEAAGWLLREVGIHLGRMPLARRGHMGLESHFATISLSLLMAGTLIDVERGWVWQSQRGVFCSAPRLILCGSVDQSYQVIWKNGDWSDSLENVLVCPSRKWNLFFFLFIFLSRVVILGHENPTRRCTSPEDMCQGVTNKHFEDQGNINAMFSTSKYRRGLSPRMFQSSFRLAVVLQIWSRLEPLASSDMSSFQWPSDTLTTM